MITNIVSCLSFFDSLRRRTERDAERAKHEG